MTPQLAIWLLPIIFTLACGIGIRYLDLILKTHREEMKRVWDEFKAHKKELEDIHDDKHQLHIELVKHIPKIQIPK
jgi:Mg2+ and Co2+ transporter CorA